MESQVVFQAKNLATKFSIESGPCLCVGAVGAEELRDVDHVVVVGGQVLLGLEVQEVVAARQTQLHLVQLQEGIWKLELDSQLSLSYYLLCREDDIRCSSCGESTHDVKFY